MKIIKTLLNIIFVISVIIILIIVPLLYFSFNKEYYNKYVEETDFQGLSKETARSLIFNVISYMQDEDDLSPEFTGNERSHLADVKNIFSSSKLLLVIAIAVIAGIIIAGFIVLKISTFLLKPLFYASVITLAGVCLLLISMLTNFGTIFVRFHEIFFPQGNYSFPANSLLIKLFPETFFQSISISIFTTIVIASLTLLLLTFLLIRKK